MAGKEGSSGEGKEKKGWNKPDETTMNGIGPFETRGSRAVYFDNDTVGCFFFVSGPGLLVWPSLLLVFTFPSSFVFLLFPFVFQLLVGAAVWDDWEENRLATGNCIRFNDANRQHRQHTQETTQQHTHTNTDGRKKKA